MKEEQKFLQLAATSAQLARETLSYLPNTEWMGTSAGQNMLAAMCSAHAILIIAQHLDQHPSEEDAMRYMVDFAKQTMEYAKGAGMPDEKVQGYARCMGVDM
jgi:hypothetical protein